MLRRSFRGYLNAAAIGLAIGSLSLFLKMQRQSSRNRSSELSESDRQDPRENGPFAPSRKYNKSIYPSEGEHRVAEQYAWGKSLTLNKLIFCAAVVAAVFAGLTFIQTKRQADYAQDQLSVATPPIMKIFSLQVWNKGHGSFLDPSNPLPNLKESGNIIEGSAIVANVGKTAAVGISSDVYFQFRRSKPGMNNPRERNIGNSPLYHFQPSSPFSIYGSPAEQIDPGEEVRWANNITVPDAGQAGDLYAFGNIRYNDTLGIAHGIYFIRRYDPDAQDFVTDNGLPEGIWAKF